MKPARILAAVATVAAVLTPLAGQAQTPEGGGWRTFATCFSHTVPGAQPSCMTAGTGRTPNSPRYRYRVTGPDDRLFVAEVIRCYTGANGPSRGRVRDYRVDTGKGQHTVAFRPFRVDTNGDGHITSADGRARTCYLSVTAMAPNVDGDVSVFMEASGS